MNESSKLKEIFTKKRIMEWLVMTFGVALASFTFSFFLNINDIVIGGVSGISVILKVKLGLDPSNAMLIINIVLLVLGFICMGKEFFLKNAYGSIMYPVFTKLFDWLYEVLQNANPKFDLMVVAKGGTADYMLVIIFSSILMGAGLGYVMKYGGSTGGTETPQNIMFKYFHIPFSVSLYIIDGTIILLGFILMGQDINTLLYEIVFLFANGFVMDAIIFSGFNKRAVYIISNKTEEIMDELLNNFARGVTSFKVVGEFTKEDKKMLLCVLSSSEYYKIRDFIEKIDDKAFFFAVRASEVRGEGFSYESESNG